MACHIHRGVLLSAAFLFVRMPHSKMRRLNAAVSHSASAPPTRSLASSSQKALTQNKGADARLRRCSAAQALTHNTGSGAECIRAALYEGCSRVALAPLRAVQGGRKHILNTSSTLSSAPQRSRDAPCACACPCPALPWNTTAFQGAGAHEGALQDLCVGSRDCAQHQGRARAAAGG